MEPHKNLAEELTNNVHQTWKEVRPSCSIPVTQATDTPPGSPSLNRMRNVPGLHWRSSFSASDFCMKPCMELCACVRMCRYPYQLSLYHASYFSLSISHLSISHRPSSHFLPRSLLLLTQPSSTPPSSLPFSFPPPSLLPSSLPPLSFHDSSILPSPHSPLHPFPLEGGLDEV